MASLENFGSLLRLPIFPPTTMETPSFSGLWIFIGGQTVKQFPQYIHLSGLILILFFAGSGVMARVGQEAIVVGISQSLPTSSSMSAFTSPDASVHAE